MSNVRKETSLLPDSKLVIIKNNGIPQGIALKRKDDDLGKILFNLDDSYLTLKEYTNGKDNSVLYVLYYLSAIGCYFFRCYDINHIVEIYTCEEYTVSEEPIELITGSFLCDGYPDRGFNLFNIPGSALRNFEDRIKDKFGEIPGMTFGFELVDIKTSRKLFYLVIKFENVVKARIGVCLGNDNAGEVLVFNTIFSDLGDILISEGEKTDNFVSKEEFFASSSVKRLFLSLAVQCLNGDSRGCSRDVGVMHQMLIGASKIKR